MGVIDVKNDMSSLNSKIHGTKTIINNLYISINGVTPNNMINIIPMVTNCIVDINILKGSMARVYRKTSIELHILFRSYNTYLLSGGGVIDKLLYILNDLINDILKEYIMLYLSMATYNIDIKDVDVSKIKSYSTKIREFNQYIDKLSNDTITNNAKLIIKNNRG